MSNTPILVRLVITIITCILGFGGAYLVNLLPGEGSYWMTYLGWCVGCVGFQTVDALIAYKRFKTIIWK